MDDIADKIADLKKRHAAAVKRKASLSGQLEARKQEFETILQEIREAGFDPKNIGKERDRVETELRAMIESYDQKLKTVESALDSFPK